MANPIDPRLAEALIHAATARADAAETRADNHEKTVNDLRIGLRMLETRLHATEITLAEARGASTGWAKAPPWVALVLSAGTALHSLGVL